MNTENDFTNPDLNVKKRRLNSSAAGYCNDIFNSTWNLFANTGKFYLGLSEASLEAIRTFNSELYRCFDEENYDADYTEAILERNTQFYERMAENSKRTYEHFKKRKAEARSSRTTEPIDYNKLAKMVAEELRKNPGK